MFDIGFFELLLVAIVGLVVIGPERLPGAVRTTAKWWSRVKHTLANARNEFEREVGADEIRREIHNDRVLRELRESRTEIEQTLSNAEKSIAQELSSEVGDNSNTARPTTTQDYLPEEEEGGSQLEDPEYPEHLHDHGDPAENPHHPQHSLGFESDTTLEDPDYPEHLHDHSDNPKKQQQQKKTKLKDQTDQTPQQKDRHS